MKIKYFVARKAVERDDSTTGAVSDLSIRDGLDSIVLNKMNQQLTLLSQEETAEVKRREGLIKNLTDDFVTLGD